MHTVQIPIVEDLPDLTKLQKLCEHHNCKIKKLNAAYYEISSEACSNIFWLGCNWNNAYLNSLLKQLQHYQGMTSKMGGR